MLIGGKGEKKGRTKNLDLRDLLSYIPKSLLIIAMIVINHEKFFLRSTAAKLIELYLCFVND